MSRTGALIAVLVLATLACYWPAIHGGFIWDDDDYLTQNSALESTSGLARIWFEPGTTRQYYPLVHSSYWIESRIWGFEPLGYHLVNVLLHIGSALLLWRLLLRLGLPGAWFAAALFALHPVHVESVAWITERKNTLSGLLYLAAALAYLRSTRGESMRWGAYATALLCFAGALLSKTVTVSLPAALMLVAWWKDGGLRRRAVLPLLPMFAIAIPMGLLTIWMEKVSVGARGAEWELSLIERTLIAGRALWFYAAKLAWPVPLTFIYPRWQIDAGQAWQYLFPAAALAVVALLWIARGRIGRGPLVAVLFFGGTLFPALGFIDVFPMKYSFVADHFQYLASLGLIVPAAVAAQQLVRRIPAVRSLAPLLAVAILAALGSLTWQQGRIYRDAETLWRDTIAKNPTCWMAHVSLGNELVQSGRGEEALSHYRTVLEFDPDNLMAHNNVGVMLINRGRIDEAARHFRRSFEIDPDDAMVQANMGDLRRMQSRFDDALEHYRAALERKPDHAPSHYWSGMIRGRLGHRPQAVQHLEQALRLDPTLTEAREALAHLQGE